MGITRRQLSSEEHNFGNDVILFIFFGLTIGQLLKHACNKFRLPYTPILTITGMIIGAITEHTKALGDGSEAISNIDPHTFFLIFLPPLIFESAFSADWHIVKVELVQILILAGPCLLASAFLTAVVMRYVLWYQDEFTFEAAVMFGALISATDPVAVVALLKELGASRTLSTLIEGESLFNDGTAYVMFSVTLELVKGEKFEFGPILGEFCRLSFGGPLLGILFGAVITLWLRRIVNNPILETNLTIVGAFLVFYTAEGTDLEVSGILALVCLGLFMTRSGRTGISHVSEETLHHVWTYLGYICETIVFLLAGVIITLKVFEEDNVIEWQDYFKCIALYVLLHLIRFFIIFVIKWPMSKLGYGMDWREATVLGYSGLRGAVSLSLALIVRLEHDVDHHIQDIVLFHTAGIAILTLVINGSTMGFLVRALGMMRMPEVKKKLLRNLIKAYRKEANDTIDNLKGKKNYGKVDWEELKNVAGADKIRDRIFKNRKIEMHQSDLSTNNGAEDIQLIIDDNENYTEEELYAEAKHRYLISLKGIYWDFFEQGQCTPDTVLLLIESASRAIDHHEDDIKDFTFIESYFHRSWCDKVYIKLQRVCFFKYFVRDWLYHRLSFEYDTTVNYIEAHEECLEFIEQIVYKPETLARLKKEVKKELKKAEIKLYKHIEENFPEVTKAIQHRRGGHYLINHMKHFIDEMVKHGQMEEKEAYHFTHHLHKEARKLMLGRVKFDFENVEEDVTTHSELCKIFSQDDVHKISPYFKNKQFDRGEVIIEKGSTLKNVYYISKGVVHEKAEDITEIDCRKVKNRAGDMIGLQFITQDSGKSFTNCYAKTVCTCQEIPIAQFRSIITSEEQEIKLWCYVGPSIIKLKPDQFSRFHDLNERDIKSLLLACKYKKYNIDDEINFGNGAILIEGKVRKLVINENSSVVYSDSDDAELLGYEKGVKVSYALIYPTETKYTAIEECRIFHMPSILKEGLLSPSIDDFNKAFHKLSNVTNSQKREMLEDHTKQLKKRNTVLLGIPKQFTNEHPVEMLMNKRMSVVQKYGRGNDKSVPLNLVNHMQRSRDDSIVPRGVESDNESNTARGKSNKVRPTNNMDTNAPGSSTENGNHRNTERHGILPPINQSKKNQSSEANSNMNESSEEGSEEDD